MNHRRLSRLGLGVVIAALGAAPAHAATTSVNTSMCSTPVFSQPFAAWQDTNSYTLASGQTADNFNGAGWKLSGGAKIVTATLSDGRTGSVLDLPAGSKAVSPTICVASNYPDARMMVNNLSGSNGGNVGFAVSYAGTSSAITPQQTGTFKTTGYQGVSGGWLLSAPSDMQPGSAPGWQPMQITLTASDPTKSEFHIYNLYIDPRCSW
jgi:hypothetical protein